MRVEPLTMDHLNQIEVQPAQAEWLERGDFDLSGLTAGPNRAWAIVDQTVLACAGLLDQGWGRALAWALISPRASGPAFLRLHRAVQGGLRAAPFRRVEIVTDCGFEPARRWAELLGFQHEGRMKAFTASGDADRWAYVNGP